MNILAFTKVSTFILDDRQYTYLGTRGFGLPGDFNTRVFVSINGNRINDATYDQVPIGRAFPPDLDLIERIEFIPGPGSAVYGQNAMLPHSPHLLAGQLIEYRLKTAFLYNFASLRFTRRLSENILIYCGRTCQAGFSDPFR